MNRDKILDNIRHNQPKQRPPPDWDIDDLFEECPLLETFTTTLERIGGAVVEAKSQAEAQAIIQQRFPNIRNCYSSVPEIATNTVELANVSSASDLDNLQLVVIRGLLGVAENGAVWIPEQAMGRRIVPFITEHLVVVLSRNSIVHNMHQAYKQIEGTENHYGVFIAGPSKTADIEQSLVIGAHGPLSHTVILV